MSAASQMIMPPSGEAILSECEELRRVALAGTIGPSRGVGFALLLRRGMAVWMEACVTAASPSRSRPVPRQDHHLVPADLRSEVALVLAAMALAGPLSGGITV
jgi:hypothetical protein